MEQFLQDQGITTLFFGGVNTDQCVYGTLVVSSVLLVGSCHRPWLTVV